MESNKGLSRYQELATKWLNKTITPAEEQEFAAWYNADQENPLNIPADFAKDEKALWARILFRINQELKPKKKAHSMAGLVMRYAAAAILLIMVFGGSYIYLRKNRPQHLTFKNHPKNDALPGSDKAVLTLANGAKIILNTAKNGVLASQGKTVLNKAKGNILVYQAPQNLNNTALKAEYNTIATPKGGQFQVILPDGSKVWLNAASSIKFPTAFTGNERKVTITGEVYFEVTKNKAMPFRVVSGKQTIEVLGTHFNVCAYSDESQIKTTLVEGSVKLYSGTQTALLKPSQQAIVANNVDVPIKVKEVDTEDALAWKNGIFEFESADIALIMRQAARWYNVDIDYEGKLPLKKFTGSISRNVNLSELLNILKYTGVNFKITGKTIIVTP